MKRSNIVIDWDSNWIDKEKPHISVSAAQGFWDEPFDKEGTAKRIMAEQFNNSRSKYFHMTTEMILEAWENKANASKKYGSLNDDYIGCLFEGDKESLVKFLKENKVVEDPRLNNLIYSTNQFFKDFTTSNPDIEYVAREKMIYYDFGDYWCRGRFDMLVYDKSINKYILIDWKTSAEIDKRRKSWTNNIRTTKYPCINWYFYTFQLYFYKMALLNHYLPEGTKPEDVLVKIVHLPGFEIKEIHSWYEIHGPATEYYENEVKDLYEYSILEKLKLEDKNLEDSTKDCN